MWQSFLRLFSSPVMVTAMNFIGAYFMQEIFRLIRFFFTRIGRSAYKIAKVVVLEALKSPELFEATDDQRRAWAVKKVTDAIVAEFGSDIPGLKWYVNLAVELAVGWLRATIKNYQQDGDGE